MVAKGTAKLEEASAAISSPDSSGQRSGVVL